MASKPDQISCLPDDILCHILSFLPTKQSVHTTFLSTRWKYLFASVHVLDFQLAYRTKYARNRFTDFVNFVWILYDVSRMHKFRLCLSVKDWYLGNHCPIALWILAAIRREVQEIDVSYVTIAYSRETTALPCDLFSCKTLSVLRIVGYFNIFLPGFVCLPCLKTCDLQDVCFSNESAKRLFGSLPALETLKLSYYCVKKDVKVLNIDAPNLKRLTIDNFDDKCQIELNVPNLIYFEYIIRWEMNDFIGLESLNSVIDASIDYEKNYGSRGDVVELLRAVCLVRKLTLSSGVIQAFVRYGQSLPTFNNLTHLAFGPILSKASNLLQELLNNSPRLEYFAFNQWPWYKCIKHQNNYALPEYVPTCVSLHIKQVECLFFNGLDYERELLKYFRKNAKNLKDMKIESKVT